MAAKQGVDCFEQGDLILYACGSRSDEETVNELKNITGHFLVIGDAKRARTVKEATYEGFCAAMDII